jgi:hypothetical protein
MGNRNGDCNRDLPIYHNTYPLTLLQHFFSPDFRNRIATDAPPTSSHISRGGGKRLREAGFLIVFKTGSQELPILSIQLGTTLRQLTPQDILFFSDAQITLGPHTLHDALRNVDQSLPETHPDFEIYRKIKEYQETGRVVNELKEEKIKGDDRAGWRLDKYKFLAYGGGDV